MYCKGIFILNKPEHLIVNDWENKQFVDFTKISVVWEVL
jgi:hypothetical protein